MNAAVSTAPPLSGKVNAQLSIMMFLQYAIWGAWLPIFYTFLTAHRGFKPSEAGNLFSIGAVGAIFAPFIAGQIADRYFNTERFLGIVHLLGAVLVWQLGSIETYAGFVIFGLLYSLAFAPTLALTNSLAFHHLPDRDRDFGRVRVWGTVGWIAVGIFVGQLLYRVHTPDEAVQVAEATRRIEAMSPEQRAKATMETEKANVVSARRAAGRADAFKVSAILGAILGIYCFFLPKTPPQPGRQKFAPWEALRDVKKMPLLALFLISFPISVIHQFYFVLTDPFLSSLNLKTPFIDNLFGIGGGPMTIGQIAEIFVLAFMPLVAKKVSRKGLLVIGLLAYILRFFVFAFVPSPAAVFPALALHGLCFGCFFFVAFMIVDEETTGDVRASAQSLFNLVIIAFGVIAGNFFAGWVAQIATVDGKTNFQTVFQIPMWIVVGCLVLLLVLYPKGRKAAAGAPEPAQA